MSLAFEPLDMAVAPIWLIATVVLVAASWKLSGKLHPTDPRILNVAHAIVLSWACIVLTAIVLGTCGILTAFTLLLSSTGVAALSLTILQRARTASKRTGDGLVASSFVVDESQSEVPSLSKENDARQLDSSSRSWICLVWSVLIGIALLRVVIEGLLFFPTDWDSLMYHMPLVDHWVHEQSLYAPAESRWYVPGNNELIAFWLVAPFSGDFLISLNNVPALILLALMVVELASVIGLSPLFCHLGGMTAVSSFPVLKQIAEAENDLAAAALFIACVCYTFRYCKHGRLPDLFYSAIAIGLLAGVKYYALGYAGAVGLTFVLLTTVARGWRAASLALLSGIAGGLLFGGYWYIRNIAVTGAPLYPHGFSAKTDIFRQLRPHVWESSLINSGRPEVWPLALECFWGMAGPIHCFAVLTVPLTLLLLLRSYFRLRRGPARGEGLTRLGLAFLLAVSFLIYVSTPNVVEVIYGTMNMLKWQYLPTRFALCFFGLAVVGTMFLLQTVHLSVERLFGSRVPGIDRPAKTHLSYIVPAAVGAVLAYQIGRLAISKLSYSVTVLVLLFDVMLALWMIGRLGGVAWIKRHFTYRRLMSPVAPAVFSVAVFACLTGWLANRWHEGFTTHFNGYLGSDLLLQELETLRPTVTRVCVCDYRYYPFFGSRRQFRLCRPLWVRSQKSFEGYLLKQEADLLVIIKDDEFPGRYARIIHAIRSRSSTFVLIHDLPRHSVFRINRNFLAGRDAQASLN